MNRTTGPEYPTIVSLAFSNSFGQLWMLFLVCKLTGLIDWPWVWVLAPMWAPIVVAFLAFGFLIAHRLNKTLPDWRRAVEDE